MSKSAVYFHKQTGEDVNAYRFPVNEPIAVFNGPRWLRDSVNWSDGAMRMALNKNDASLVILTHAEPLSAHPGDWIVWTWNNEGSELQAYTDELFRQTFHQDEPDFTPCCRDLAN